MTRTLFLAAGLLLAGASQAQSPTAVRNEAGAAGSTRIELKDYPGRKGEKAALFQAMADTQGQFFQSSGNWVLTPIAVTVMTQEPSQDVVLKVFKDDLEVPVRAISSKGKGHARVMFRTQGDYTVQVSASSPTPYQLLVWTGKDLKPDLPSAVKVDKAKAASKRSKP